MPEIIVRAKPGSSVNRVEKVTGSEYIVRTTEPPIQGRANRAIIDLLATHLGVATSQLSIVSGRTSRIKKISIT